MKKIFFLAGIILALGISGMAQTAKNQAIFAVLNDGKMIEPLAKIENGKLLQPVSGGDEMEILTAFSKSHYKPKTAYSLIFGGKVAGEVIVIKNDPKSECVRNMATVKTLSRTAKLKGFVMGLATNIKVTKAGSGLRRKPTAAERLEIEKLVVAEFKKNKVNAKALRSHNLTALDIDNDGKIEFVGTYWVATSAKERALLFFIADKVRDNKYSFGRSEFSLLKESDVMSQDIKDLDQGVYHEMLLDVLDFNNDGVAEIFTYIQSFEGAGFNVYRRNEGVWEVELESLNYHCGY